MEVTKLSQVEVIRHLLIQQFGSIPKNITISSPELVKELDDCVGFEHGTTSREYCGIKICSSIAEVII